MCVCMCVYGSVQSQMKKNDYTKFYHLQSNFDILKVMGNSIGTYFSLGVEYV